MTIDHGKGSSRNATKMRLRRVKLQIPGTKHQRNTKHQTSKSAWQLSLELGYWSFSGAWMLELGAFCSNRDGGQTKIRRQYFLGKGRRVSQDAVAAPQHPN
ncbi:MAG: hypothetical protein DME97_18245 [Verrucomicrobia bacterium]|nr:MAG: hypothetical protein DME97_18245 [Verrucomicrobiota bacterium]